MVYFCIKILKRKRSWFCWRNQTSGIFERKSPKEWKPKGPNRSPSPQAQGEASATSPPAARQAQIPEPEVVSPRKRQTRSAITSKPLPRVAISLLTHGSQKPSRVSRGCLQSTRSTRESRRQVSTPEQPLAPLAWRTEPHAPDAPELVPHSAEKVQFSPFFSTRFYQFGSDFAL